MATCAMVMSRVQWNIPNDVMLYLPSMSYSAGFMEVLSKPLGQEKTNGSATRYCCDHAPGFTAHAQCDKHCYTQQLLLSQNGLSEHIMEALLQDEF